MPNGDWIAGDRKGLTICDATSAAFAQELDWPKLDVVTFSWQKVLGGEAAHGVIILSPRAAERLETYTPPWPLPKLFRLAKGGKLTEGFFEGETINTPSMLCVEDYLDALNWAKSLGGLKALFARADANAKAIADWVERTPWIDFLARAPETRSNTSVCLKVVDPAVAALPADAQAAFAKAVASFAREGKGRVRHRRLSRRAAWLAHLVRCDGRNGRRRGADALARLRLRYREEQARQSGLSEALSPPRKRGSRGAASGLALDARFRGHDTDKRLSLSFSRPFGRHSRTTFMTPRVLISDKLSPAAVAIFKERGVEVDVKPGLDKEELAKIIGGYDGLAIRSATKVTAKLLGSATKLKVVGRAGIGVDNVDIPAATARGVIVMNTPFGNSITTAEHAIALMFALARQIPSADVSTQAGKVGKEPLHGRRIDRQDARNHWLREYRRDRRLAGPGIEDAGRRL